MHVKEKSTRDLRQEELVSKIIGHRFFCWYSAFPGFGKTKVCTMVLGHIKKLRASFSIAVIVPTNTLKKQWTDILTEAGYTDFNIYVINGVAINEIEIKEDITFMDEAHTYIEGKVFGRIFSLVKSKALIPFSGTFKPEHEMFLNSIMPCADKVTMEEGRREGWIAEYKEYNLYITLDPVRQAAYNEISKMYEENFAFFGHDFNTAKNCITARGAGVFIHRNNLKLKDNTGAYMDFGAMVKHVTTKANIWRVAMQNRSEFINLSIEKVQATAYLVNLFKRKTITFGLLNETSDLLTKLIPNSESYHSGITGQVINGKKLGAKKVKEFTLLKLADGIITCVNTSKALDLGADVPGLSMSVIYARHSTKEKNAQRIARTTRKEEDKLTLVVNVILKDTKDESWTKSAQMGRKGIINVNSVDELEEHFKQFEK